MGGGGGGGGEVGEREMVFKIVHTLHRSTIYESNVMYV